jgi:hypothetical protein
MRAFLLLLFILGCMKASLLYIKQSNKLICFDGDLVETEAVGGGWAVTEETREALKLWKQEGHLDQLDTAQQIQVVKIEYLSIRDQFSGRKCPRKDDT